MVSKIVPRWCSSVICIDTNLRAYSKSISIKNRILRKMITYYHHHHHHTCTITTLCRACFPISSLAHFGRFNWWYCKGDCMTRTHSNCCQSRAINYNKQQFECVIYYSGHKWQLQATLWSNPIDVDSLQILTKPFSVNGVRPESKG